jgi:DNA-directed RNA polymerase specialized sigma24 family protein
VRDVQPQIPVALEGVIDADEILQHTFLQVFQDILTFLPARKGPFYAWLQEIAEDRLLHLLRVHQRSNNGENLS